MGFNGKIPLQLAEFRRLGSNLETGAEELGRKETLTRKQSKVSQGCARGVGKPGPFGRATQNFRVTQPRGGGPAKG